MSLVTQLQLAFVRIGTEFKTIRSEKLTSEGDLTTLTTTAKSNLVAAINEVKASLSGAGAVINDTTASSSTVYSSTKSHADASALATAAAAALISDASATTATTTTYSANKITAAIAAASAQVKTDLTNGATSALDTFKEVQDLFTSDESTAAALATSVGNRLRVDATQSLTTTQQQFGRDNLSVYSEAQIGDPTTDFAAGFTAALV